MALYDIAFAALVACFLAGIVLAGYRMVRDVLPLLPEEERESLRGLRRNLGTREGDRALRKLWSDHCRFFPDSYTRLLVGLLVIGMALVAVSYPLMLVFAPGR